MRQRLSTTMKKLLTQANPRPKRPVLQLVAGSDLEEGFGNLWRQHGNGLAPTREFQFARRLGRKWRFDFAWPDQLVAVELEGIFRFGDVTRHQRAKGFQEDCAKYNSAVCLGWAILRFTSDDIKKRPLQAIDMVRVLLDAATRRPESD